jgi:hypothetical protein
METARELRLQLLRESALDQPARMAGRSR